MEKNELIKKIMEKKEFSDLPKKDVEKILDLFKDEEFEEDKIKKTRALLKKVYTAFVSDKILNVKDKDPEWFLKKHASTRERLGHYEEIYSKILNGFEKVSVLDLGAGINGFSYDEFLNSGFEVDYCAIEPVGQLVKVMNYYFKTRGLENCMAIKESLFELGKVKRIIKQVDEPKVLFLFKVLDSLEMVERDYSKKLLLELVPLVERVVVSYATKSLISGKKFFAQRKWLKEFIENNFEIVDEFEAGIEKYIVFKSKNL
jgi:hypothetical protein